MESKERRKVCCMNKINYVGRATKDIELTHMNNEKQTPTVAFTIAIKREGKPIPNRPTADYPYLKAYGFTAKYLGTYGKKGDIIEMTCRTITDSYMGKDNVKKYVTYGLVESCQIHKLNRAQENTNEEMATIEE